ncbi:MAG: hypothetical protein ABS75_21280 [Pelagibacterium sp. SCN 63-23]|nr:MAG: hypothetical protein ABS75_21280 [Pelagibacterium sp. SCN 63-23]
MIHSTLRIGLVALAALGAAGVAATAGPSDAALACGVSTVTERGMLAIEGVLQSPTALAGEYRFALKSSGAGGSTNINQGGQFSAAAGSAVSLGRVMVNAGAKIDVEFTITSNGRSFDCSEQFAART